MSAQATLPLIVQTTGSDPVLRVNSAFVEHFGYDASAIDTIAAKIHKDDRGTFEAVAKAGGTVKARMATQDGDWSMVDWTVRLCTHGADVALLGRLAEAGPEPSVSGSTDLASPGMRRTLDMMARIVEAKNPGMKCSILLVDKNGEYVTGGAGPSLPCAYNQAVEGLRIGPTVGSCGTAAFWNVPIVVEDIADDPLWRDLRDAAKIAGVAACWSHPVTTGDGEVLGAMALYSHEPGAPTQRQMDGLEIAARMVGLAVERENLEEQLRQAAKMEALGVLAGGVAHDFNNLLTVILGNAELAQTRAEPRQTVQQPLEEIIKASVTAAELCDRMLAFAGRGSAAKQPLELNALVREVGDLMQAAISKKIALDYNLTDAACGLEADRGQLSQVLMNLITNASEAIGAETGRVLVSTNKVSLDGPELESLFPGASLQPGEYIRLTIADDGDGMSEATLQRMYDPFFTTKKSGRGLGLAAVRGIIKKHAGGISVTSTQDRGTTFVVALPTIDAPEPPQTEGEAAAPQPARILVVDDEPNVREVMCQHLQHAGHSVVSVATGEEALEMFAKDPAYDCVLLDYSLPGLDGFQVFQQLRAARADVRVILMSGFTEQETTNRFESEALAGFLHKPARARAILDKVAEVMGSSFAARR